VGLLEGELHPDLACQLDSRDRSHRTVEMLVQLGLGQRANRGERFHLRMIGALTRPGRSARLRSVALGAVAICGIGLLFGLRPADPMLADPALAAAYRRQLETTARDADTALRQLGDGLQLALGWARQGAANTLSGEAAPGPQLAIAGGQVEALDGRLGAARAALARLESQLAVGLRSDAPRLALAPADLASIGQALRGASAPSDAFAAMRLSSQGVLTELRAALIATDAGQSTPALAAISAAQRRMAAVRAYQAQLVTLPIWADTTAALLDALQELGRARLANDLGRERRALRSYASAAANAAQADRALAIALAEGGAAISRSALQGMADALAQVQAARDGLAPLVLDQ